MNQHTMRTRFRFIGTLVFLSLAFPVSAQPTSKNASGSSKAGGPEAAATKAVLGRHLGSFAKGIDAVMADYTESSVFITPEKTYRGLREIRGFFDAFITGAKPAFWKAFKVRTQVVQGQTAYLVWEARPFVSMATDTLIVHNNKVLTQTFTALSDK